MKVELKKLDKIKVVIKALVSGEEFIQERDKAYLEIGRNLKVPGFRPGAVPLAVLKQKHAKVVGDQFLEKFLPQYYAKALDEAKVSAASYPNIFDIELAEEQLSFSAEVETRPELELAEKVYKGIKIKQQDLAVSDKETDKVLDNVKEEAKSILAKDLDGDELAKWAGYPTIADFKAAILKELEVEKLRQRRDKINNQIIEHLLKAIDVELPKSEVERQHAQLVERQLYDLRMRGISEQDLEKYKKDIEEKLKSVASDQVKLFYIFETIVRQQNLKAEKNPAEAAISFILSQATY